MRIWDLEPEVLCHKHLLGEHRELHAIWTIITSNKKGYRNHPETKRWVGKLKALYQRHESLAMEMKTRGFEHKSPLDRSNATGSAVQSEFVNSKQEQRKILNGKKCLCVFLDSSANI